MRVCVAVCTLLWVALLVILVVAAKIRFAPRPNTLQEEKDGSKLNPKPAQDQRRVWPQTAVLLPALASHYHAHHLTVHQPQRYETQKGRHTWHFGSLQKHLRKQARADIILHADAAGLHLKLKHPKSPTATLTSYILSLTNVTTLKPHVGDSSTILVPQNISHLKQSNLPEVTKISHETWTAVDVTQYLQDWLFHGSDLWVEVVVLHRLGEDARRKYSMLLLQPTVCVWDDHGDESASENGYHLETSLKFFLEAKVQEKTSGRLWLNSETHRGDENEFSRQRNRRAVHSGQCKVRWVEVSKQELGLGLVVFPDTLVLKYCAGSCHILDHPDIFSTNALFRAKYRFLRKSASMPSPHCIPTNFHHQHFFVWDTQHIKMIKVWDLDAAKCGCR